MTTLAFKRVATTFDGGDVFMENIIIIEVLATRWALIWIHFLDVVACIRRFLEGN
jgi:hypothetical protein